jgi:large subunit ribosomal protein L17
MRHGKKINHLGRKKAHRDALLMNLSIALITHKRINTTVAKAKALRVYVEPLITKSKEDTTHNRRIVFSYLQDKEAVAELFREVSTRIADRPGGYLRIIKLGNRQGDNAEMAMIEFVDFNTTLQKEVKKTTAKKRTRRGAATTTTAKAKETVEAPVETAKEETKETGEVTPSAEATEE